MVCRAEIFKFLVNQELCSLFNTLLIVLSHKGSAPFEHALNMFHSSASLYRTGGRMPTPQPTPGGGTAAAGNRRGPGEALPCSGALPRTSPHWDGTEVALGTWPLLLGMACGGVGGGGDHSGVALSRLRGPEAGCEELAPQAAPSAATGCLLRYLASIYCYAPLTFTLTLTIDLQD